MVWIFRTYKCRLARLTKSIQETVLKYRQQKRTVISYMAIFSLWWKYRNNRFICNMQKTSSFTFRLRGTTNFRSIQNILPTKICWVLFPIDDLRQAVETGRRIFTKDMIDRQLARQSSSTPFMSIKGYIWHMRWIRRQNR